MPDVSVATAETLTASPGLPYTGAALKLMWNGADREVKAKTSLIEKSTNETSFAVPTSADTVEFVFSMTRPLLSAVSERMAGGIRLVVENV